MTSPPTSRHFGMESQTSEQSATGRTMAMKSFGLSSMKNMALSMGMSGKNLLGSVREKSRFRLRRTRSGSALTTEPEMLPAMITLWSKTTDELPVAKDLPRLARRVVVVDENGGLLHGSPSVAADEDTSLKRSLELTAELIVACVKELEGKERADEVGAAIRAVNADANESSDAEALCKKMMEAVGTEETSAAIRALKMVHQDIVGHCTYQLKEHITSRFMTKDVRTPEGWRIAIKVGKDYVQISHTRREQSIDAGGDKTNHWEFEWELRSVFDTQVKEMRQAQLRVTDLFMSQTIDPVLEQSIKHDLLGGELN